MSLLAASTAKPPSRASWQGVGSLTASGLGGKELLNVSFAELLSVTQLSAFLSTFPSLFILKECRVVWLSVQRLPALLCC